MASRAGEAPAGGSTLALRLALAFFAVALTAVALEAILTAVLATADVSDLQDRQRTDVTAAMVVAVDAAWARDHGWVQADVRPVVDLARRLGGAGAGVQVRDRAGDIIVSSADFSALSHARQYEAPALAHGTLVGVVLTRFSRPTDNDRDLQGALLRAIAGAAGLAALLALIAALVVARRITGPVGRIIAVTRAMSQGNRSARVGPVRAPAELRELATAFDGMADTLDRQEQLRRDLVADVAHELRTPISILQAGHEALLDQVAEPTPEQLGSLREEVLRLGRMVTDLQEIAAADAAALQLEVHECDLADIAADAADSLASQFGAAGIAVERQLEPAGIRADRRWLHQIITNLLTNALKYTPTGGSITLTVRPAAADAELTVADNGVGIPPDELPHIFERFWRGRQAAQTVGTGVGLAVAAELVRAHGGALTARSALGRGTAITLTLPLS